MREARFSIRLLLAAGAAAALIAAPVTVSPHALALSWQVAAAAKIVRAGNNSGHGNAFGHREECDQSDASGDRSERGRARARDASAGRVHEGRGWHDGRGCNDGNDEPYDAPVDDEAPPS